MDKEREKFGGIRNAQGEVVPIKYEEPRTFNADIEVYKNGDVIVDKIAKAIKRHDVVLGEMYYLTNPNILNILKTKRAALVLQRSKLFAGYGATEAIRREDYRKIRGLDRGMFHLGGTILNRLPQSVQSFEGVRCMGRMDLPDVHRKTFIFCEMRDIQGQPTIIPREYWSGSYNTSKNTAVYDPVGDGPHNEMFSIVGNGDFLWCMVRDWAQMFVRTAPLPEKGKICTTGEIWECEWTLES